jgi:hypothetical protein
MILLAVLGDLIRDTFAVLSLPLDGATFPYSKIRFHKSSARLYLFPSELHTQIHSTSVNLKGRACPSAIEPLHSRTFSRRYAIWSNRADASKFSTLVELEV